jgi:sugar phosphate isomerase/epimerase
MDVRDELLALEDRFWHVAGGDRDGYEANLAEDAVHAFPGWGVTDRERVLQAVAESEPWDGFTIDDPHLVPLGRDAAALVYTTHADRRGRTYDAAITSVYRRREDGWELVVHQQTPL